MHDPQNLNPTKMFLWLRPLAEPHHHSPPPLLRHPGSCCPRVVAFVLHEHLRWRQLLSPTFRHLLTYLVAGQQVAANSAWRAWASKAERMSERTDVIAIQPPSELNTFRWQTLSSLIRCLSSDKILPFVFPIASRISGNHDLGGDYCPNLELSNAVSYNIKVRPDYTCRAEGTHSSPINTGLANTFVWSFK